MQTQLIPARSLSNLTGVDYLAFSKTDRVLDVAEVLQLASVETLTVEAILLALYNGGAPQLSNLYTEDGYYCVDAGQLAIKLNLDLLSFNYTIEDNKPVRWSCLVQADEGELEAVAIELPVTVLIEDQVQRVQNKLKKGAVDGTLEKSAASYVPDGDYTSVSFTLSASGKSGKLKLVNAKGETYNVRVIPEPVADGCKFTSVDSLLYMVSRRGSLCPIAINPGVGVDQRSTDPAVEGYYPILDGRVYQITKVLARTAQFTTCVITDGFESACIWLPRTITPGVGAELVTYYKATVRASEKAKSGFVTNFLPSTKALYDAQREIVDGVELAF